LTGRRAPIARNRISVIAGLYAGTNDAVSTHRAFSQSHRHFDERSGTDAHRLLFAADDLGSGAAVHAQQDRLSPQGRGQQNRGGLAAAARQRAGLVRKTARHEGGRIPEFA
jgi:hypothetical protein